jgi:DUF4097 and DUF4098 domain-containing protein YvlB
MQNQQFEHQEWQPSSQPQYVNTDPREQQEFYPQPGYIDQREKIQPVRRRRRLWLWIIGGLVILALLGSGVQAGLRSIINTSSETHSYVVSANTLPTLVLNDTTGTVTVHTGSADSNITIEATKHFQSFGSAPTVQYSQNGNIINATVQDQNGNFLSLGSNNVDFNVAMPANANLQIHTATGSIDVSGVSGTMSLSTATGSITANQDALSGQSTLQTNTGDITFDGSITSSGIYQFSSDTGSVDVTLPASSSFHVDATTDTGSIDSDFSEVNVHQHDVTGSDAHGDVGSSFGANIKLTTNTGDINLHKGQ